MINTGEKITRTNYKGSHETKAGSQNIKIYDKTLSVRANSKNNTAEKTLCDERNNMSKYSIEHKSISSKKKIFGPDKIIREKSMSYEGNNNFNKENKQVSYSVQKSSSGHAQKPKYTKNHGIMAKTISACKAKNTGSKNILDSLEKKPKRAPSNMRFSEQGNSKRCTPIDQSTGYKFSSNTASKVQQSQKSESSLRRLNSNITDSGYDFMPELAGKSSTFEMEHSQEVKALDLESNTAAEAETSGRNTPLKLYKEPKVSKLAPDESYIAESISDVDDILTDTIENSERRLHKESMLSSKNITTATGPNILDRND